MNEHLYVLGLKAAIWSRGDEEIAIGTFNVPADGKRDRTYHECVEDCIKEAVSIAKNSEYAPTDFLITEASVGEDGLLEIHLNNITFVFTLIAANPQTKKAIRYVRTPMSFVYGN